MLVRGEPAVRLRRALRGIGRLPVLLLRALAPLVGCLAVLPGVIRGLPVLARARLRWARLRWARLRLPVLPGAGLSRAKARRIRPVSVAGGAAAHRPGGPGAMRATGPVLPCWRARVGIGALGIGVPARVRAVLAPAAVAALAHRLRALALPASGRWLERPAARRSLLP